MITGKTLIDWGIDPRGKGKWFGELLAEAQRQESHYERDHAWIKSMVEAQAVVYENSKPPEIPLRTNIVPYNVFLEPESLLERDNHDAVVRTMDELMRVPTVVSGVVMPDACPAGVIPVGGVVATKDAIHPGFHSADICCSMAITVFKRKDDLKAVLDIAQHVTHFGPGARKKWRPASLEEVKLLEEFAGNRFLTQAESIAETHMMTQGDGNHFLFVGTLRSTGQPAIVTHHGSRGLGALLYKRGMAVAKKHTAIHSPRTPAGAAWIDANSDDGRAYWAALQIVRRWTKINHFMIHDEIQQRLGNKVVERYWNEHNFVFRRDDGLYYHAKGATPSFKNFSPDDIGATLIPLNMSQPILITEHRDKKEALGFSPHGAGRNMSRTGYMKGLAAQYGDARGLSPRSTAEILALETQGIDARFYLGTPDLSELPSAYKSAEQVQRQIQKHGLADVVDHVDPYGCIMAGEMNWQRRK